MQRKYNKNKKTPNLKIIKIVFLCNKNTVLQQLKYDIKNPKLKTYRHITAVRIWGQNYLIIIRIMYKKTNCHVGSIFKYALYLNSPTGFIFILKNIIYLNIMSLILGLNVTRVTHKEFEV